MSYVKGDRVRMRSNPTQVGTVTGERDQMFLSFVGVQWQSGDFGFVAPSNLEWVGSNMTPAHIEAIEAIAGMSKADRASLAAAHRMAMDAVEHIVGQSKPSPGGKDLTDWQARAEQAEAKVARVWLAITPIVDARPDAKWQTAVPFDELGGNLDDIWEAGQDNGEAYMAKCVLAALDDSRD